MEPPGHHQFGAASRTDTAGEHTVLCTDSVTCWGSKRSNQVIVLRHINTGFSLELWASSNGWARVLADGVCNVVWSSGAMEKQSFDPVSWALVANLEKSPQETILQSDETFNFGHWVIEPKRENITIKNHGEEKKLVGAMFVLGGNSLQFHPKANNAELLGSHHPVEELFESRVPMMALTVRGRLEGKTHVVVTFTGLGGDELTSVRLGIFARIGGLRFVPAKLLGVSRQKVRLVLEDGRILTEDDNAKLITVVIGIPGAPTTSEEFAQLFDDGSSDEEEDNMTMSVGHEASADPSRIGHLDVAEQQSIQDYISAALTIIFGEDEGDHVPKSELVIVGEGIFIPLASEVALQLELLKEGHISSIRTTFEHEVPEITIGFTVAQAANPRTPKRRPTPAAVQAEAEAQGDGTTETPMASASPEAGTSESAPA